MDNIDTFVSMISKLGSVGRLSTSRALQNICLQINSQYYLSQLYTGSQPTHKNQKTGWCVKIKFAQLSPTSRKGVLRPGRDLWRFPPIPVRPLLLIMFCWGMEAGRSEKSRQSLISFSATFRIALTVLQGCVLQACRLQKFHCPHPDSLEYPPTSGELSIRLSKLNLVSLQGRRTTNISESR